MKYLERRREKNYNQRSCRREGLQLLWVGLLPQILFPLSPGLFPFRGCAHSNIGKRGLFTPFRLAPHARWNMWALKPGFQLSPSSEFWSRGFQLKLWNHLNWILFRFSFHILCKVLWHQKAPPNQSLSSGVWWSNIFIHIFSKPFNDNKFCLASLFSFFWHLSFAIHTNTE